MFPATFVPWHSCFQVTLILAIFVSGHFNSGLFFPSYSCSQSLWFPGMPFCSWIIKIWSLVSHYSYSQPLLFPTNFNFHLLCSRHLNSGLYFSLSFLFSVIYAPSYLFLPIMFPDTLILVTFVQGCSCSRLLLFLGHFNSHLFLFPDT